MSDQAPADPDEVQRRILDRVERFAASHGRGPAHCEIVRRSTERWSETLQIRVGTPAGTEDVFVKRVTEAARQRADSTDDRPRLKPFVGFAERPEREAEALRVIETMVDGAADGGLFSVRVLPIPADDDTLYLAHVPHPTLADLLRAPRRTSTQDRVMAASRAAGTWLRLLHQTTEGPQLATRFGSRDELEQVSAALLDHISSRVTRDADALAPALRRAVDRVPESLPVRPAHADFAAHNVFVDDAGAVAVFDTALDWCLPPHYDLAYFSVMLDFADLRRLSPTVRAQPTEGLRAALLAGYGPAAPPERELRAFEVAIVLEKWASLSEGRHGSPVRRAAKAVRSQLLERRLRRVLGGLLAH